jgi:hypothetical protein
MGILCLYIALKLSSPRDVQLEGKYICIQLSDVKHYGIWRGRPRIGGDVSTVWDKKHFTLSGSLINSGTLQSHIR